MKTHLTCITALMVAQDPTTLPGKGLAQHSFLYCGEWDTRRPEQTMYVVRGRKVVWTYSIPNSQEVGDCTLLSNGHIVFSRKTGASEITPDKTIVWNYDAPPTFEIHTAQPIGLDRVLIMQNGDPATAMVIHKSTVKIEKQLVLPTRRPDNPHGQFRHIRLTKNGTFVVAHLDLGRVVEYDESGRSLWSVPAPSAWAAVRLPNGNTLINNWAGSRPKPEWPTVVQLIEVTPDKKVVWALRDWDTLGPASSTQLLDEPGVAEKGEHQR